MDKFRTPPPGTTTLLRWRVSGALMIPGEMLSGFLGQTGLKGWTKCGSKTSMIVKNKDSFTLTRGIQGPLSGTPTPLEPGLGKGSDRAQPEKKTWFSTRIELLVEPRIQGEKCGLGPGCGPLDQFIRLSNLCTVGVRAWFTLSAVSQGWCPPGCPLSPVLFIIFMD